MRAADREPAWKERAEREFHTLHCFGMLNGAKNVVIQRLPDKEGCLRVGVDFGDGRVEVYVVDETGRQRTA